MRPAFLLLARFGKVTLPLPWFAVWLVLLPLAAAAWPVGVLGSALGWGRPFRLLAQSPRLWLLSCCLGGLRVRVRSDDRRVCFSFV